MLSFCPAKDHGYWRSPRNVNNHWAITLMATGGFWLFPKASFGLQVLSLPGSVCPRLCVWVCINQSWACLHDDWSSVQARIDKFRPQVQNAYPYYFGIYWFWPSWSSFTLIPNVIDICLLKYNYQSIWIDHLRFTPMLSVLLIKIW